MKLLPDTHLLIWAMGEGDRQHASRLSGVLDLLETPENEVFFSAVSIWEVAIKFAPRRSDFRIDPAMLRQGLVNAGFEELPVRGAHAERVASLPALHKDPFDRLLLAQAMVEGMMLVTADERLSRYPGPILQI